MFRRFLRRGRRPGGIAPALYGAIVAQARTPALYTGLGVPDTLEGRFEMVVLHTALVVGSLRESDEAGKQIGQGIFDLFCEDMDRSLRELGVGDLAVPKRMRSVAEAFYGRSAAYEAALAAGGSKAMADAVQRMILGGGEADLAAKALAHYIFAAADGLSAATVASLRDGELVWPAPATFVETSSNR